MNRLLVLGCLAVLAAQFAWPADQKKKRKEEEQTQTLEVLKDPPGAVTGETARLVFQTAPLSSRGLLSQQVRDALKWLIGQDHGKNILKLRAFVAGTGDMRRVQAIVSETFTEKRLALPALSVVQIGGLPQVGAQVALESIAMEKKPADPNGIAFLAAEGASEPEPLKPVAPLLEKTLDRVRARAEQAGGDAASVVRVTCYVSSLDDAAALRERMYARFPQAAMTLVQRLREPADTSAGCEGVARVPAPPAEPVRFLENGVAVGTPRIALTGTQMAFGRTEGDARLALQRLGKALEQAGASYDQVVVTNVYALSPSIGQLVRKLAPEFYGGGRAPASTVTAVDGLPSLDAAFAIEAIAALR